MKRKRGNSLLRSLLLGTLLLMGANLAHATFPGKNGRIAFIQDSELFTMNPDGTSLVQLTHLGPDNAAAWPAWSADGKQIVFNEFPPPQGVAQIWAMNADGSNQHLVLAESDFAENRPSFSPDGSKIVFGRCDLNIGDHDTCAIYTIGANGGTLQAITAFHEDTTARNPVYSPDGKTLAFIISPDVQHGFQGVTYLVNADGSNMRRITQPGPCLIRPDWSPDGAKITTFAHFCNPQNETIAVMNADGTGLHYLTDNGLDYFNGPHDRNPAFSPDGNFIVFERHSPDFSNSGIYVMKADGTQPHPVVMLPGEKKANAKTNLRSWLKLIEDGGNTPRWGVAHE